MSFGMELLHSGVCTKYKGNLNIFDYTTVLTKPMLYRMAKWLTKTRNCS